ncbi:MAG: 50S ribosomal protein L39e [Candidatus Micrarchaeia archaeon]
MSKKSPEKKARLRRARKKAKPVPLFVRLKTARRVMSTPARRHWREKKLKIKV